jgi:hypothetical protein
MIGWMNDAFPLCSFFAFSRSGAGVTTLTVAGLGRLHRPQPRCHSLSLSLTGLPLPDGTTFSSSMIEYYLAPPFLDTPTTKQERELKSTRIVETGHSIQVVVVESVDWSRQGDSSTNIYCRRRRLILKRLAGRVGCAKALDLRDAWVHIKFSLLIYLGNAYFSASHFQKHNTSNQQSRVMLNHLELNIFL